MAVLRKSSCKPILDCSDLKNSIPEGIQANYTLKSGISLENEKKCESPFSKSLNISNDALDKSVCSTTDVNSTSTDLMPFYSEPSSLKKSSSFMNFNNLIMKNKLDTIATNLAQHQHHERHHRHRHHRNSIADSNPTRISNSIKSSRHYEDNFTNENFLEKSKDFKENSYKYFIDSLNCDTNCSCAFHKNSTKQQSKPCTPLHQYYHHPYYHHNSFDQNLRLSQLNLLTETSLKNDENTAQQDKLSNEIVDKNVGLLNGDKEKNAYKSRSLLEKCFMLMLSFFGKKKIQ